MENKGNRNGSDLTRGWNWMQTMRGILQYWSESMDYLRMHAGRHGIVNNIDQTLPQNLVKEFVLELCNYRIMELRIVDRNKEVIRVAIKETGAQHDERNNMNPTRGIVSIQDYNRGAGTKGNGTKGGLHQTRSPSVLQK